MKYFDDWYGYREYDAMMCGEKDRAILEHQYSGDPEKPRSYYRIYCDENEDIIREIIRYAIEKYAGWTPEEAYQQLTLKKLSELKLRHLIRYGLRIPYEANVIFREERSYNGDRRRLDDGLDPQYIVSFAYPELFPYSPSEEIIKSYKMILSGEIERVPKGYFVKDYHPVYAARYGYKTSEEAAAWTGSTTEIERAVVCLAWVWEQEGLDLYDKGRLIDYMSHRTGRSLLKMYHLRQATKLFGGPVEYTMKTLELYPKLK